MPNQKQLINRRSSGTLESIDSMLESSAQPSGDSQSSGLQMTLSRSMSNFADERNACDSYDSIPALQVDQLPRGGISIDTKGVGRIQFGIPPETIKDSMQMGIEVPRVYIVPAERFCRDMGPALGINLAEFEFPAYFNFFVRRKKCILLVDSEEAESDIRKVFEETLLGPREFRNQENKLANVDDDFDPSFPIEDRPDFYKELEHFRILDAKNRSSELTTDMLIEFSHFSRNDNDEEMGAPPLSSPTTEPSGYINESFLTLDNSNGSLSSTMSDWSPPGKSRRQSLRKQGVSVDDIGTVWGASGKSRRGSLFSIDSADSTNLVAQDLEVKNDNRGRPQVVNGSYSKVKWLGEKATIWPMNATPEQIKDRSAPRVEVFRMPGGAEYVLHEVDADNSITGKVRISGTVRVPDEIAVEGFLTLDEGSESCSPLDPPPTSLKTFHPPSFGITVLGNSHGFDKNGSTSGYVIWINGRGVMVDPPPYSSSTLEKEGILPQMIIGVIITHCHADHDAGAFQKILTGSRVAVITSPSIYKSFIRKYAALSGLKPSLLRHCHRFRPAIIGQPLHFQGAVFHFTFSLHVIPCIAFRVECKGRSIVFTGDHLNHPTLISELEATGVLSPGRAEDLRRLPLQNCDVLLHEAGTPPVHTPLSVLQQLPEHIKERMYVVHTSALPEDSGLRVAPVGTEHTIRLPSKLTRAKPRRRSMPNMVKTVDHFFTDVSDDGQEAEEDSGESDQAVDDRIVPGPSVLRPVDTTDAWFVLNLLSKIPFFSSLSYLNAMEVLEISKVRVFGFRDTVVVAKQRSDFLCVVWEGTLMATKPGMASLHDIRQSPVDTDAFQAGCWFGPIALQPESSSGATTTEMDVVVASQDGAKIVILQMADLEKILLRGSESYRKYLWNHSRNKAEKDSPEASEEVVPPPPPLLDLTRSVSLELTAKGCVSATAEYIIDTINSNSVLNRVSPSTKRSIESIVEGPTTYAAGSFLWEVGKPCDNGFLVVSGTATQSGLPNLPSIEELLPANRSRAGSIVEGDKGRLLEVDRPLSDISQDNEYGKLQHFLSMRALKTGKLSSSQNETRKSRQKVARDRFLNKVLVRLNASRRYVPGLVFSRGCFLCDTSRMVSGELVLDSTDAEHSVEGHVHSSSIVAGEGGCTVYVFPRSSLTKILDANPGLLLSLLGTQVIV